MIKESNEEYVVEFSVTIIDPTYSELLSDPEAPHLSDITRELTEKVRKKAMKLLKVRFYGTANLNPANRIAEEEKTLVF